MTIAIYQILLTPIILQAGPTHSLGLDILIYTVIAIGFIILGYFISDFVHKAKTKTMEAELEAERERLGRRINTLEKEVKHLYAKDDQQIVLINDLKKQLSKKSSSSKSSNKKEPKENPPDLFGSPQSGEDEE